MRAQPNRRASGALLAAVGGVLVGHWLTYRLVSPHAGAADQLLKGTGHAYLGYLNDLVLVGALGALAAIFLGRLIQRDGEPPRYRTLAARLIAFQGAAFVAMEAIERLASGSPLASLLHHGLLPAGIAIQALVALAIALLIHLLLRAADIVAAALLPGCAIRPRRATAARAHPGRHVPARPVARSAVGVRGPPALSSP